MIPWDQPFQHRRQNPARCIHYLLYVWLIDPIQFHQRSKPAATGIGFPLLSLPRSRLVCHSRPPVDHGLKCQRIDIQPLEKLSEFVCMSSERLGFVLRVYSYSITNICRIAAATFHKSVNTTKTKKRKERNKDLQSILSRLLRKSFRNGMNLSICSR